MMLLLLLMPPLDDNSISLYCHVVINSVINVTPTHTIFKKRLNDLRWYSDPDDDDDDDVMADAEYSPIFQMKMKARTYLHYYYFKSHIFRWNYWIIYIFCQGGLTTTETYYQTNIRCDVHKIKWYFLDAREDLMGGYYYTRNQDYDRKWILAQISSGNFEWNFFGWKTLNVLKIV